MKLSHFASLFTSLLLITLATLMMLHHIKAPDDRQDFRSVNASSVEITPSLN